MNNRIEKDICLYRMVVAFLCLTVIASVAGAIVMAITGQSTSEIIVALGSAAIGGWALGSLTPKQIGIEMKRAIASKPLVSQQGLHYFDT